MAGKRKDHGERLLVTLTVALIITHGGNAFQTSNLHLKLANVSSRYFPKSPQTFHHTLRDQLNVNSVEVSPINVIVDNSTPLIHTSEDEHDNPPVLLEPVQEQSISKKSILSFPRLIWRFSRPHTLVGSALAIPALHILAAPTFSALYSKNVVYSILYAMFPALLMNIFITGLNQITDVEIDKINKPDLPIAAGDLKLSDAKLIVAVCLAGSLLFGAFHPVFSTVGLNTVLWGSALLGAAYSLPPFRLKRFPVLAAFAIVAIRGTLINTAFYAHASAAAFGNVAATPLSVLTGEVRCALSTLFFGVFSVIIAIMKDVPDFFGDKISNIRTFSVRLGRKAVFKMGVRITAGLYFLYGAGFIKLAIGAQSAILAATRSTLGVASFSMGLSALKRSMNVNAEDSVEVYSYYMHLWKLFYLSYFLLPFAR